METSELIDDLVGRGARFNGVFERVDALKYLNLAHKIMMEHECEHTLIFDEETGRLPQLVTIKDTHAYLVDSLQADSETEVTVWRVSSILVRECDVSRLANDYWSVTGYDRPWGGHDRGERADLLVVVGGVRYLKYGFVKTRARVNDNTPIKIIFTHNPGDTTNFYHLYAFRKATAILSESIQPDMPDGLDYELLIPATAELMQGVMNGDYDAARKRLEFELKPKLWKQLDAGANSDIDLEPVHR